MIKMIVTDIDGTLINDQGIISKQTQNILIKAQQNGIRMVIATGRSPQFCQNEISSLHMELYPQNYTISLNGQNIYEFASKTSYLGELITPDLARNILRLAFNYDLEALCYTDSVRYLYQPPYYLQKRTSYLKSLDLSSQLDIEYSLGGLIPIYSYDYLFQESCSKISLLHSAFKLKETQPLILKHLDSHLQALLVKPTWLEIMPSNISKGRAIRKIMNIHQISANEVLVFGDGENDIDMIKSVTYGYAMGNAPEHVKKIAYGVTESNNDDGIASVVKCFL
jgi:Cof subfamily protein (haloacid dehalogenase superfamily)